MAKTSLDILKNWSSTFIKAALASHSGGGLITGSQHPSADGQYKWRTARFNSGAGSDELLLTDRTNATLAASPAERKTANSAAQSAIIAGTVRSSFLLLGLHGVDNWRTIAQAKGLTGREVWRAATSEHGLKEGTKRLLYTGITPNILRTFFRECARGGLIVAADEHMKNPLLKAGALTVADITFMPFERAKVLANTGGAPYGRACLDAARSGSMAQIRDVIASGYKGSSAMAARQGARWAMFFAIDDEVKNYFKERAGGTELSLTDKIMAACVTGAFTGIVPVPADVIKSRMQAQAEGITKGFMEVAGQIWREQGLRGFARGGLPKFLLTAIPSVLNSIIRSVSIDDLMEKAGVDLSEWTEFLERHRSEMAKRSTVVVDDFSETPITVPEVRTTNPHKEEDSIETRLDKATAKHRCAAVSTPTSIKVEDFTGHPEILDMKDIAFSLDGTKSLDPKEATTSFQDRERGRSSVRSGRTTGA
jgi:hypothetical protein